MVELSLVFRCFQSSHSRLYYEGGGGGVGPGTISHCFMEEPHCWVPMAFLPILVLPQKEQMYLA